MAATEKYQVPVLKKPALPPQSKKVAYPSVSLDKYLTFSDILEQVPTSSKFQMTDRVSIENLEINGGSGQKQGYVLYRKNATFGNARFSVS
jgi:hypothetical protein